MSNLSIRSLSEEISITKGKKPRITYESKINDECLPYVLIENFSRNYTAFTDDRSCKKANPENILLVWDGERAGLSSIGHYGYIGSTLVAIEALNSELSPEFLYRLFEFNREYLRSNAEGTGVPHLSRWAVENLEYTGLPLPEQQKIAAILTSVDDVIESTQSQINKLKDLKTGMMQELLTKGIGRGGLPYSEFKDSPVGRIPKEWEVVKLSDVLEKIDSGWSPNCIETPPNIGEWGVLKVSSVTRDVFLEEQSKVLPKELEPRELARVKAGDILLTRANGVADLVGKCVMVMDEPKRKLMMSDKILRLKPNEKIDRNFLLHSFNSALIRRQIEFCWGGSSGQKNIGQSDIKDFVLPLPSLKEQVSIGKAISQIDNYVSQKSRKMESLQSTKKALMQDLLTGKVRVKVN